MTTFSRPPVEFTSRRSPSTTHLHTSQLKPTSHLTDTSRRATAAETTLKVSNQLFLVVLTLKRRMCVAAPQERHFDSAVQREALISNPLPNGPSVGSDGFWLREGEQRLSAFSLADGGSREGAARQSATRLTLRGRTYHFHRTFSRSSRFFTPTDH